MASTSKASDTLDPRLPLELEQEIFLYTIENDMKATANLLLVSKQVREWLLPTVFKVVILYHNNFYPIVFNRPALYEKYGAYIQRLFVSDMNSSLCLDKFSHFMPHINLRLASCPNLTDLALWSHDPRVTLETLMGMSKLTRLSIDASHLSQLFPGFDITSSDTENYRPTGDAVFPNITHLNLLRTHWRHKTSECQLYLGTVAYHFPALTHFGQNQLLWWGDANRQLIDYILKVMKTLKVLVLRRQLSIDELGIDEEFKMDMRDERVVPLTMIWETVWGREAREMGLGMWSFADRVVEERKKRRDMVGWRGGSR